MASDLKGLPREQEEVKLAGQAIGQRQPDQSRIHSILINNGKQRGENDQKAETIRKGLVWCTIRFGTWQCCQ